MAESNKPVLEFRFGLVKAIVWPNATEQGTFHRVTFAKLYKKDGQWRDTTSFDRDDLPLVGKVADMAHTWLKVKIHSM
jgi:hypothetical protein